MRTKVAVVPEVGDEAPEFNLPSAQGGQLRLSMRTARGPVVVVFYRGLDFEEDVEYFKALADKEDEINLAAGSVVGVGVGEPDAARELVLAAGIRSYVLYDYARVASREWGLLQKDKKLGEYARSAVFIVGADHSIVHAWLDERPDPAELLAKVSEITGLPKPPEEEEEKPAKPKKGPAKASAKASAKAAPKAENEGDANTSDAEEKPERQEPSPEDREKRRAERKAASEAGETSEAKKPEVAAGATSPEAESGGEKEPQAENTAGSAAKDAGGGSDTGDTKEDDAGDTEAQAGGEEAEPEEKTGE